MKINNGNNLLKELSAIFDVQHMSDPPQFSQGQTNLKIYLLTKTSFGWTILNNISHMIIACWNPT